MQSIVNLSIHLIKPTNHAFCCFFKTCNSWASAMQNASSPHKALLIYSTMHRQSLPSDTCSMVFTLKSCTQLKNHAIIQQLHAHISKLGFGSHVYVANSLLHAYNDVSFVDACALFDEMPEKSTVMWNTMISGYLRSGDLEKARLVFDEMQLRDVISWSTMITAYAKIGDHKRGLSLFRNMVMNEIEGLKPDRVIATLTLTGCAHMGSLGLLLGKSVHGFTVKNGWKLDVKLGTVLVDMYAKCGFLRGAARVFELMQEKNVMTWTAMICGSAQHSCSKTVSLFEKMQKAGVRPNELTLTGILSACAHTGLIEEGRKYFKLIEEIGLEPRIQHYGCMVDLYGKAGLLEEAYVVIQKMPLEPNVIVWNSFLSACKEHKQFEMAERVVEQVMKMVKPNKDGGVYSLIADLYDLGGKWNDARRVRKMVERKVRKVMDSTSMLPLHLLDSL